jgi:membrane-bound lytic murein transglycosylase D
MSTYWLINAQSLATYTLFNPYNIEFESSFQLKGWKEAPKRFKSLKKENKLISYFLSKKSNEYKFIETAIAKKNLPKSFSYLPVVLSGYQSSYQDNFGGVGIWALNYITALHNGVVMNRNIDERKNDSTASVAAINELERLMNLYNDEKWCILAFITSPSYVNQIRNQTSDVKWEELKSSIKPKYLRVIEFIYFLDNLFFINSEKQTKQPFQDLVTFNFEHVLTFDAIYEYSETNLLAIKEHNPSLINNNIPLNYKIKLPLNQGKGLKTNQDQINQFQDSMVNNLFLVEANEVKKTHLVVKGDVLGKIAETYGVKIKDIMKWNNLDNSTIYIDQKLELYSKDKLNNHQFEYCKINKNDTFWELASQYPNHSLKDILKYNKYSSIKSEKKLRIIKK